MIAELKEAWLAALRSGNYKQTIERLQDRDFGGYCCLGVLCDVFDPSGWDGVTYRFNGKGGNNQKLPDAMLYRIGMSDDAQEHLMELNDSNGYSFKEIADYIEERM